MGAEEEVGSVVAQGREEVVMDGGQALWSLGMVISWEICLVSAGRFEEVGRKCYKVDGG